MLIELKDLQLSKLNIWLLMKMSVLNELERLKNENEENKKKLLEGFLFQIFKMSKRSVSSSNITSFFAKQPVAKTSKLNSGLKKKKTFKIFLKKK